eukprot:TRINITY_DN13671_c0_g1_i3.p1 TRINITY_DN13671_c0_g1~~TRINITY_DN13671_c0_g1_i3.p1  ORF type:complete len:530 (-),score=63.70 TRINITY_DN13671_c0_g1_i3:168-1757(-)
MQLRRRLTYALLFMFTRVAFTWPSVYSQCGFDCVSRFAPGSSFGHMGIDNFGESPTGSKCEIATNVPMTGYVPGQTYTVTVTSTSPLAQLLVCNDQGQFADGKARALEDTKVQSKGYTWTATGSTDAVFHALCGAGGNIDQMWVADALTVKKDISANSLTQTPSPTPSGSTSSAKEGVELMPAVRMTSKVSSDGSVRVTVTARMRSWIGFGLSPSTTISMTGSGNGADVYVCSEGDVRRYWVTSKTLPATSTIAAGASCTQANGETSMTVVLSGSSGNTVQEITATPGTRQSIIFAHGDNGETAVTFHGSRYGGKMIDFASGAVAENEKLTGEAALYLHMVFMSTAWGALLPWGVAIASRMRGIDGFEKSAWFTAHKRLQLGGWILQLLGFAMALWHCQTVTQAHFTGLHSMLGLVVVVIGTLQPFNAFLRKCCAHPEEGVPKTRGRKIFELVHKGSGWLAILLGMVNAIFGALLVVTRNYSAAEVSTAFVLVSCCIASSVVFWCALVVKRDNACARSILRFVSHSFTL